MVSKTAETEPCREVAEQIQEARVEVGLTQSELADRLGMTQQNISEIERGDRSVGIELLRRISRALGKRLEIKFKPGQPAAVQSSEEIRQRLQSQSDLFQEYGIEKLILFGSAAQGELTPDSDIDLVVFSDEISSYWELTQLRQKFENILGRNVDLATRQMVEHIWEEEIEEEGVELRAA